VPLARREALVLPDPDPKTAALDHPDRPVKPDPLARMVALDPVETKEAMVSLEPRATPDPRVATENQDPVDPPEIAAPVATPEVLEPLDPLVDPDPLEDPDPRDRPAHPDPLVPTARMPSTALALAAPRRPKCDPAFGRHCHHDLDPTLEKALVQQFLCSAIIVLSMCSIFGQPRKSSPGSF